MAELVGLVSAIAALVSTGYKIAKTISDCVDELGTAADQIMLIATDTKAVARIFQELKVRLKSSTKVGSKVVSLAQEIVELGQKALQNIQECLLPLIPLIGKSNDPMQKARWLFAKSKITSKRTSIDSLKLTMMLLLHTIDVTWGDADETETREEVQQLVVSTKATKMNFIKAEIADQAVEQHYQPRDKDPGWDDPGSAQNLGANIEGPGTMTTTSDRHDTSALQVSTDTDGRIDSSVADLYEWAQTQEAERKIALNVMPILSDDQFVEIAEHLMIQRAVTQYALVTLSNLSSCSHDQTTPIGSGDHNFDENTSRARSERQRTYHSEEHGSGDGVERVTDKPEPRVESFGSASKPETERLDRQDGASTQQHVRERDASRSNSLPHDTYQPGGTPHGQYFEQPPGPQYSGYEQSYHRNAQRFPSPYGSPGAFPPQQHYPFPYHPNSHWQPNEPSYVHDPEKEALKRQLEEIRAAEEAKEAEARQKEYETRIREEAEDNLRQRLNVERKALDERKTKEAEAIARAQQAARDQIEAERRADEARAKREMDIAAAMEQTAKSKLEAALKDKEQAEAAAQKMMAEEAEWRKLLEEEAKLKAEIEARQKIEWERAQAEEAAKKKSTSFWKRLNR